MVGPLILVLGEGVPYSTAFQNKTMRPTHPGQQWVDPYTPSLPHIQEGGGGVGVGVGGGGVPYLYRLMTATLTLTLHLLIYGHIRQNLTSGDCLVSTTLQRLGETKYLH